MPLLRGPFWELKYSFDYKADFDQSNTEVNLHLPPIIAFLYKRFIKIFTCLLDTVSSVLNAKAQKSP